MHKGVAGACGGLHREVDTCAVYLKSGSHTAHYHHLKLLAGFVALGLDRAYRVFDGSTGVERVVAYEVLCAAALGLNLGLLVVGQGLCPKRHLRVVPLHLVLKGYGLAIAVGGLGGEHHGVARTVKLVARHGGSAPHVLVVVVRTKARVVLAHLRHIHHLVGRVAGNAL